MKPALLFLFALLAGQPAIAQKTETELSTTETRRLLAKYGACVAQSQHARASAWVLANIDNSTLRTKYRQLVDGSCLPAEDDRSLTARFKGDQYRYALAGALVAREFANQPAPVLDTVPRLDHRDPGEAPSRVAAKGKPLSEKTYKRALEQYEMSRGFAYLSQYGECVVRVNQTAARNLLLTEPASSEEAAAFNGMRTALGTCLPENATLNFGKLALRGTIAVNYYRLAHAAARTEPK